MFPVVFDIAGDSGISSMEKLETGIQKYKCVLGSYTKVDESDVVTGSASYLVMAAFAALALKAYGKQLDERASSDTRDVGKYGFHDLSSAQKDTSRKAGEEIAKQLSRRSSQGAAVVDALASLDQLPQRQALCAMKAVLLEFQSSAKVGDENEDEGDNEGNEGDNSDDGTGVNENDNTDGGNSVGVLAEDGSNIENEDKGGNEDNEGGTSDGSTEDSEGDTSDDSTEDN